MFESTVFTRNIIDSLRNSARNIGGNEVAEGHHVKIKKIYSTGGSSSDEGHWMLGRLDSSKISSSYSSLSVKNDYTIYSFAWMFDNWFGGHGIPYAIPKSITVSKAFTDWVSKQKKLQHSYIPEPQGALKNFMEAIDGDGTPLAYMSASIFSREVNEKGAFNHGSFWRLENMLYEDPEDLYRATIESKNRNKIDSLVSDQYREDAELLGDLEWLKSKPKNWDPVVYNKNNKVIVKFFTFSGYGFIKVRENCDVYSHEGYVFNTKSDIIAKGSGGYQF